MLPKEALKFPKTMMAEIQIFLLSKEQAVVVNVLTSVTEIGSNATTRSRRRPHVESLAAW